MNIKGDKEKYENDLKGHMICDIGSCITEIFVFSLGDVLISNSIRIAEDDFDHAIIKYVRNEFNLIIGGGTSERLKIEIYRDFPDKIIEKVKIKGTDSGSGLPKCLEIDSGRIREILKIPFHKIVDEIKSVLDRIPPEITSYIVERGIVLSGKRVILKELSNLISKETGASVIIVEGI